MGKRSKSQKYLNMRNKELGITCPSKKHPDSKATALEKIALSSGPARNVYYWSCPGCEGTYTWSDKINSMWGHPSNKAFCAACCKYYEIDNLPDPIRFT